MIQYEEQKSIPDIVAYGKMLTGGYLTMAATLTNKKIYDSYLGEFNDWKHFFHGHTYTGNPIAAAVANENLKMYKKNNLIKKIQKTSKIFEKFYQEISEIDIVGDVRHKGMLMGIELVTDKKKKTPIHPKKSINKIFFEEGKKQGIYLRTLGNIVMLVPPLAISEKELDLLLNRTIKTIQTAKSKVVWLLTPITIKVNLSTSVINEKLLKLIMNTLEFIKECQEKVFSGIGISSEDTEKLFNIPDENLKDLASCANEITRDFNGYKVDVEQLNNIKKNACSEDCTFCG